MSIPKSLTSEGVRRAAAQLGRSEKGRNAMRHLLAWLDEDGISLDVDNQDAVITLLAGAWGPFAGTARDAMRERVAPIHRTGFNRRPRSQRRADG